MCREGPAYLVVTPEAVGLELSTASVVSRVLARCLDLLVLAMGLLVLAVLATLVDVVAGATLPLAAMLAGSFAAVLAYPVLMEGLCRGQTLGKRWTGLRVVRTDGGPIGVREAAVRGALGLIDVWATSGSLGLVFIIFSRQDQRLGDMAAGTLVLREDRRRGDLAPAHFYPPPGYEQIVANLNVMAMTERDYEQVRAFLLRWAQLRAPQRAALAATIAGPLWQRMRQPLPPGTQPDIYLACLGCAYQMRHTGRQANSRAAGSP